MSTSVFTSGSNTLQRVLPCHPGYAMGGIIRTGELELPYLEQQVDDLDHTIKKIEELKASILSGPQTAGMDPQKQVLIYSAQIKSKETFKRQLCEKLKAYQQEKEEAPYIEDMLPIDYSVSKLDYRYRSDESENMHFVTLKKQSTQSQISDFASHLTKMRYLPEVTDLVDQLSKSILDETRQEDQEVCLLGSFVTLSHVRVIDPIVIRQDAELGETFTQRDQAEKYSVITESVLGGVFIGFGSRVTGSREPGQGARDPREVASSLSSFSFVSQGAIPETHHFNLWETYNSWKKKITSDTRCGFPIAFKVRKLMDVLKENQIF